MITNFNRKLFLTAFLFLTAASSVNAANAFVTITGDPDDGFGNCATPGGACSLREAINFVGVGGFIFFDIPPAICPNNVCTINLTRGTLNIVKNLSIVGPGARNLIVQRSTAPETPFFGIFRIGQLAPVNAAISGIAISNGNNTATGAGGGAILTTTLASLTLSHARVFGNAADGGGGIANLNGDVTIIDSTVSGNQGAANAGGVLNSGGTMTIVNSTVSGNTSAGGIGGIYNQSSQTQNTIGTLNLINSTIANNTSAQSVGGLGNDSIHAAMFSVRNTIVAGNAVLSGSGEVSGVFQSEGSNLVQFASLGSGFGILGSSDIVGQAARLSPLADNGGQTDTHALLPNSPAIDAGNNCVTDRSCSSNNPPPNINFEYDQRSQPFARKFGSAIDIGAFEAQGRKTNFDFDGDGKTDIGVFRNGSGEWWLNLSSTGATVAARFGNSSDRPVPGDFTGDGRADIAFFRPSTGEWFILRSEDGSYFSFSFGRSGDLPVVSDFDGDGQSDPGVFRPSTNEWYISKSSGGTIITTFGATGDVPAAADYDGDSKADIAIYRPSAGQWWIQRSGSGSVVAARFGTSTDKPVQDDYTGDGKADIAFWRPSTGEWFILRSEDGSYYSVPFGTSGDLPTPGDYDGDGKADTAVFRPSSAAWYVSRSSSGILIASFGATGDRPIPNVFVP